MADTLPDLTPTINDINQKPVLGVVKIGISRQSMQQIQSKLDRYKNLKSNMTGAMEEVADYVRGTMIPNTFEKEGPGWKQLAKRTQRERQQQGFGAKHPILRRSGDLYKELTDKGHPKHIETVKVSDRVIRFEIGGSSTKFIENQLGKTSQNLPARAMIPGTGSIKVLDRDRKEMHSIIERAYLKSIQKPV